jgi:hypothetical protein
MVCDVDLRPCGRSPAEIVGSNPTGGMDVCRECCVLSGRGLCDELITHSKSYRLWCVVVCDLETSWMGRPWPTGGCCTKRKIHWPQLMLFIVDASFGVAVYICVCVCVHSVIYIAFRVVLGPVKRRRYEDPMAFMCDVSCIVASRILFKKMYIVLPEDGT